MRSGKVDVESIRGLERSGISGKPRTGSGFDSRHVAKREVWAP